jgi:Mn-containing catalase
MSELRELLVEQLQDLLSAENQIVGALPKLTEAVHCDHLKLALKKHLTQTEVHVTRLQQALETLGEEPQSKTCKGMQGLLQEGDEAASEDSEEEQEKLSSDLAVIAAAQKVEHYEISAYGTARSLAKQLGEHKVATVLDHTLGEEEAADYLLTDISKTLLQLATSVEFGNGTKMPWGEPGDASQPEDRPSAVAAHAGAGSGGNSPTKSKKTKA